MLCVNCGAGTYTETEGSTTCTKCEREKYSTVRGATSNESCTKCKYGGMGIYSPAGSSFCAICGDNMESATDIVACECNARFI